MNIRSSRLAFSALFFIAASLSARGDDYVVDNVHSAAVFRISHLGLSSIPGRFKEVSGTFTVDTRNPTASRFDLSARIDSIDTNNTKRDEHLKSPDFFSAKQFP